MLNLHASQKTHIQPKSLSAKGKKWVFKDENEREILNLIQKYGYPEIFARFVSQRCPSGVDPQLFLSSKLRDFLPDPFCLKDMDKAVVRLKQAIANNEKITIFGDYDVDGATSTSLLVNYLTHLKANVDFYIPDRIQEGYGPSIESFGKLKKRGTQLIITVDCGTSASDPLAHASAEGMDVIVIDHHIPEYTLPKAYAIVNPNREDDTSGYGYLCAVGVTFLVLVALQSHLKKTSLSLPDLRIFLDLVALGTVCDVVPLKGLNRAFVQQGLLVLNKYLNPGLKALSHIARIEGKCTPYHLGYILGPHINAGGRIGTATLGTQLLTSSSVSHALPIAEQLHQLNKERKDIEAKVLAQALEEAEKLKDHSIVCVGMDEWHPGIIGIVAGRLKEAFHKPVFVVAFDKAGIGKGSGRSIPGINLGLLVHNAKSSGILLNGGGHAMAAGLTVEKQKFTELQNYFNQTAKLTQEAPCLEIDATLHIHGATIDIVRLIDQIGPFGAENPAPIFMIPNCQIIKTQLRGEKHISCFLRSEDGKLLEAIAFNALGSPLEEILMEPNNSLYHLVGSLKVDSWQGREKVKFYIEDIGFN
jgi:single-stranded-DNA-specific exonuclease